MVIERFHYNYNRGSCSSIFHSYSDLHFDLLESKGRENEQSGEADGGRSIELGDESRKLGANGS